MRKIPIAAAKVIADSVNAKAVVVIAFNGDDFAVTSYGKDKAACEAAGKWIDQLTDKLETGVIEAPRI